METPAPKFFIAHHNLAKTFVKLKKLAKLMFGLHLERDNSLVIDTTHERIHFFPLNDAVQKS